MSIEMPSWLQWLSWVAGSEWPQGDEDALFALADDWKLSATEIRNVVPDLQMATDRVVRHYSSDGAAQMKHELDKFFTGDTSLDKLAENLDKLSKSVYDCGTQIEYVKLQIYTTLAILAAEIAYALATLWGALAVPALQAEAQGIIQVIGQAVLRRLAAHAANVAKMPMWKLAGIVAGTEAGIGFGQELLIQGIQVGKGHREAIDWKQVGISTAVSGIAGLAAFPVGYVVGKGMVNRFGRPTGMLGAGGYAIAAGIPAGVVGAFAGYAANGVFTGEWEFDPAMIVGGVGSGFIGGAHGISSQVLASRFGGVAAGGSVNDGSHDKPSIDAGESDAVEGTDNSSASAASVADAGADHGSMTAPPDVDAASSQPETSLRPNIDPQGDPASGLSSPSHSTPSPLPDDSSGPTHVDGPTAQPTPDSTPVAHPIHELANSGTPLVQPPIAAASQAQTPATSTTDPTIDRPNSLPLSRTGDGSTPPVSGTTSRPNVNADDSVTQGRPPSTNDHQQRSRPQSTANLAPQHPPLAASNATGPSARDANTPASVNYESMPTSDDADTLATRDSNGTDGHVHSRVDDNALAQDYQAEAGKILAIHGDGEMDWSGLSIETLTRSLAAEDYRHAVAAAVEVVKRGTGKTLRWSQVMGVLAMRDGPINMDAGEGKTLVFLADAMLKAARQGPVQVFTTRDTLVKSAYDTYVKVLGPFEFDVVRMNPDEPYPTPKSDRTIYIGTQNDAGFGRLRGFEVPGRRAAIDEIDEALVHANTTYVLSDGPAQPAGADAVATIDWADSFLTNHLASKALTEADFGRVPGQVGGPAKLTEDGRSKVESLLSRALSPSEHHRLANAAAARWEFVENDHYIVDPVEGKVYIIDQTTHKVMFDPATSTESRWNGGLAQAIEARHGLRIRSDSANSNSIAASELFSSKNYDLVTGASGTAKGVAGELRHHYGMKQVVTVPRFEESRLQIRDDAHVDTQQAKFQAIAEDVKRMQESTGRPQLVIANRNSEVAELSELLTSKDVHHLAVDAKWFLEHGARAESDLQRVLDDAGKTGSILVINRQGGRGVDIPIDAAVNKRGGLHVIVTSRSVESRDIDIQAENRAARNGQNGSVRYYTADDDGRHAQSNHRDIPTAIIRSHQAPDTTRNEHASAKTAPHTESGLPTGDPGHRGVIRPLEFEPRDQYDPTPEQADALPGHRLHRIPADGNCLFHALERVTAGKFGGHEQLRSQLVAKLRESKRDLPFAGTSKEFDEQAGKLDKSGFFDNHLGDFLIPTAAKVFELDLVVVFQDGSKVHNKPDAPERILIRTGEKGDHYHVAEPIQDQHTPDPYKPSEVGASIATNRSTEPRHIDAQVENRAARGGQNGSVHFYTATDDLHRPLSNHRDLPTDIIRYRQAADVTQNERPGATATPLQQSPRNGPDRGQVNRDPTTQLSTEPFLREVPEPSTGKDHAATSGDNHETADGVDAVPQTAGPQTTDSVGKLHKLPTELNFVWFGGKLSPAALNNLKAWSESKGDSDWTLSLWTDERYHDLIGDQLGQHQGLKGIKLSEPNALRNLIRISGGDELVATYELSLNVKAFNLGSDIGRYAILYQRGGVYADVDLGPGDVELAGLGPMFMHEEDIPVFGPCLRDGRFLPDAKNNDSLQTWPIDDETRQRIDDEIRRLYDRGYLGNHFIVAPSRSRYLLDLITAIPARLILLQDHRIRAAIEADDERLQNLLTEHQFVEWAFGSTKLKREYQQMMRGLTSEGIKAVPDALRHLTQATRLQGIEWTIARNATYIGGPWTVSPWKETHPERIHGSIAHYMKTAFGVPSLRSQDLAHLMDPNILAAFRPLQWITGESESQLDKTTGKETQPSKLVDIESLRPTMWGDSGTAQLPFALALVHASIPNPPGTSDEISQAAGPDFSDSNIRTLLNTVRDILGVDLVVWRPGSTFIYSDRDLSRPIIHLQDPGSGNYEIGCNSDGSLFETIAPPPLPPPPAAHLLDLEIPQPPAEHLLAATVSQPASAPSSNLPPGRPVPHQTSDPSSALGQQDATGAAYRDKHVPKVAESGLQHRPPSRGSGLSGRDLASAIGLHHQSGVAGVAAALFENPEPRLRALLNFHFHLSGPVSNDDAVRIRQLTTARRLTDVLRASGVIENSTDPLIAHVDEFLAEFHHNDPDNVTPDHRLLLLDVLDRMKGEGKQILPKDAKRTYSEFIDRIIGSDGHHPITLGQLRPKLEVLTLRGPFSLARLALRNLEREQLHRLHSRIAADLAPMLDAVPETLTDEDHVQLDRASLLETRGDHAPSAVTPIGRPSAETTIGLTGEPAAGTSRSLPRGRVGIATDALQQLNAYIHELPHFADKVTRTAQWWRSLTEAQQDVITKDCGYLHQNNDDLGGLPLDVRDRWNRAGLAESREDRFKKQVKTIDKLAAKANSYARVFSYGDSGDNRTILSIAIGDIDTAEDVYWHVFSPLGTGIASWKLKAAVNSVDELKAAMITIGHPDDGVSLHATTVAVAREIEAVRIVQQVRAPRHRIKLHLDTTSSSTRNADPEYAQQWAGYFREAEPHKHRRLQLLAQTHEAINWFESTIQHNRQLHQHDLLDEIIPPANAEQQRKLFDLYAALNTNSDRMSYRDPLSIQFIRHAISTVENVFLNTRRHAPDNRIVALEINDPSELRGHHGRTEERSGYLIGTIQKRPGYTVARPVPGDLEQYQSNTVLHLEIPAGTPGTWIELAPTHARILPPGIKYWITDVTEQGTKTILHGRLMPDVPARNSSELRRIDDRRSLIVNPNPPSYDAGPHPGEARLDTIGAGDHEATPTAAVPGSEHTTHSPRDPGDRLVRSRTPTRSNDCAPRALSKLKELTGSTVIGDLDRQVGLGGVTKADLEQAAGAPLQPVADHAKIIERLTDAHPIGLVVEIFPRPVGSHDVGGHAYLLVRNSGDFYPRHVDGIYLDDPTKGAPRLFGPEEAETASSVYIILYTRNGEPVHDLSDQHQSRNDREFQIRARDSSDPDIPFSTPTPTPPGRTAAKQHDERKASETGRLETAARERSDAPSRKRRRVETQNDQPPIDRPESQADYLRFEGDEGYEYAQVRLEHVHDRLSDEEIRAVYEYTSNSSKINALLEMNRSEWSSHLSALSEDNRSFSALSKFAKPGFQPSMKLLEAFFDAPFLVPDVRRAIESVLSDSNPENRLFEMLDNSFEYAELSQSLRTRESDHEFEPDLTAVDRRILELDRATEHPLPDSIIVMRGHHTFDSLREEDGSIPQVDDPRSLIGKTLYKPGYMSTSLKPDHEDPDEEAHGKYEFRFTLRLPAGTLGLWVGDLSAHSDEHEVLLPRGTRIKITNVTVRHGENGVDPAIYDIEAQVVSQTPHPVTQTARDEVAPKRSQEAARASDSDTGARSPVPSNWLPTQGNTSYLYRYFAQSAQEASATDAAAHTLSAQSRVAEILRTRFDEFTERINTPQLDRMRSGELSRLRDFDTAQRTGLVTDTMRRTEAQHRQQFHQMFTDARQQALANLIVGLEATDSSPHRADILWTTAQILGSNIVVVSPDKRPLVLRYGEPGDSAIVVYNVGGQQYFALRDGKLVTVNPDLSAEPALISPSPGEGFDTPRPTAPSEYSTSTDRRPTHEPVRSYEPISDAIKRHIAPGARWESMPADGDCMMHALARILGLPDQIQAIRSAVVDGLYQDRARHLPHFTTADITSRLEEEGANRARRDRNGYGTTNEQLAEFRRREHFDQEHQRYVALEFERQINELRRPGAYNNEAGDHLIQAAARRFRLNLRIFDRSGGFVTYREGPDNAPVRALLRTDDSGGHYYLAVDEHNNPAITHAHPTLTDTSATSAPRDTSHPAGLPGTQHPQADRRTIAAAIAESSQPESRAPLPSQATPERPLNAASDETTIGLTGALLSDAGQSSPHRPAQLRTGLRNGPDSDNPDSSVSMSRSEQTDRKLRSELKDILAERNHPSKFLGSTDRARGRRIARLSRRLAELDQYATDKGRTAHVRSFDPEFDDGRGLIKVAIGDGIHVVSGGYRATVTPGIYFSSEGRRIFDTSQDAKSYGNNTLRQAIANLNDHHIRALASYTASALANKLLRKDQAQPGVVADRHEKLIEGKHEKIKSDIATIDDAFRLTTPLTEPLTVFRGIANAYHLVDKNQKHVGDRKLHEVDLNGTIQTESGYLSTSLWDEAIMAQPIKIVLQVPDNVRAIWLEHISRFENQFEVLLPRGIEYRIISVEKIRQEGREYDQGRYIIQAEVLPPNRVPEA